MAFKFLMGLLFCLPVIYAQTSHDSASKARGMNEARREADYAQPGLQSVVEVPITGDVAQQLYTDTLRDVKEVSEVGYESQTNSTKTKGDLTCSFSHTRPFSKEDKVREKKIYKCIVKINSRGECVMAKKS